MAYLYYNKEKLKEIMEFQNSDPYGTCQKLKMYLTQFEMDRTAHGYYINVLITLGRLTEAEVEINKLERLIEEATQAGKDDLAGINKDKNYLIVARLKLLAWQKRYYEALVYYNKYKDIINLTEDEFAPLVFYCAKMYGLLSDDSSPSFDCFRSKFPYRLKQTIGYSQLEFNFHMRKHLSQNTIQENTQKQTGTFFTAEFPFEKIFTEVSQTIEEINSSPYPENKRLNGNCPVNIYIFKYPKCGICDGQVVDYFKVVTVNGTDIITMHPATDCEKLPVADDLGLSVNFSQEGQPQPKARVHQPPSRT